MNEILDTTLSKYDYAGLELALYSGSESQLIFSNWKFARSMSEYSLYLTCEPEQKNIMFMTIEQTPIKNPTMSALDFAKGAVEAYHFARTRELKRSLTINSATLSLKTINANSAPKPEDNISTRVDLLAIGHESDLVKAADI